jgi:outer membrane protein
VGYAHAVIEVHGLGPKYVDLEVCQRHAFGCADYPFDCHGAGHNNGATLQLSFGVGSTSDYEGADEVKALPIAGFNYETPKFSFRSSGLALEADMIPGPQFQVGPMIDYRFARDSDVRDNRVALLPEVDAAVEVGVYAATGVPLNRIGVNDPTILTVRTSFAHDVADGHEGYQVRGIVGAIRPLTENLKGILNLSTTYASGNYMNAYFDVSAASAAASGLTAFDADAGFKEVGLTGILAYQFTDNWSGSLIAGYKRLLGDAADSSVVDEAGSANQFF